MFWSKTASSTIMLIIHFILPMGNSAFLFSRIAVYSSDKTQTLLQIFIVCSNYLLISLLITLLNVKSDRDYGVKVYRDNFVTFFVKKMGQSYCCEIYFLNSVITLITKSECSSRCKAFFSFLQKRLFYLIAVRRSSYSENKHAAESRFESWLIARKRFIFLLNVVIKTR